MRSIGKPYVSEKLCFEPMYKENYSESIEQIQPKQNSRRTKKSQAACLRSGSDDTEVNEQINICRVHEVKSFLREFDPGSG